MLIKETHQVCHTSSLFLYTMGKYPLYIFLQALLQSYNMQRNNFRCTNFKIIIYNISRMYYILYLICSPFPYLELLVLWVKIIDTTLL